MDRRIDMKIKFKIPFNDILINKKRKMIALSVSAVILCSFIFSGYIAFAELSKATNEDTMQKEFEKYKFSNLKTASTIYEVPDPGDENRMTAISVEGILAQKESRMCFSGFGSIPMDFKTELISDYGIKFDTSKTLLDVIKMYKNEFNGYVTYQVNEKADDDALNPQITSSINKACTLAAAKQLIIVRKDSEFEKQLISIGLTKKADAVEDYEREIDVFRACKDQLAKKAIVSQPYRNEAIRDLGIAMKAPVYYANNDEELSEIYEWLDPMAVSLGWYRDEVGGVAKASQYGIITIPSDHAWQMTVMAGLPSQRMQQKPYISHETGDKHKHYVCFMLSDGDNLQIHVNSYRNNDFGESWRGTIPFGWSVPPSMITFAPNIFKWYYKRGTNNDCFLGGVSGAGYINPAYMPKEDLKKFAELNAKYLRQAGLDINIMLMDASESGLLNKNVQGMNNLYDITKIYSAYKEVKGGFLYYGSGYSPDTSLGATFWNYGKPYVAIRGSSWDHPVEQLAYRINHYTRDITKVESYSAINCQITSAGAYIQQFMKLKDDDVVVVTPREFIDIMTRNVTDKTTKVYLDDVDNYDWNKVLNNDGGLSAAGYDAESFKKQPVSDKTSFDFNNGFQGWIAKANNGGNDSISLEIDNNMKVVRTDGSKFGSDKMTPNTYMYNKIKIPSNATKLYYTGKYNDSAVAIHLVDANGKFIELQKYTVKDCSTYTTFDVDISKYKGQEVTIIYEARDSVKLTGSKSDGSGEFGWLSKIEIK